MTDYSAQLSFEQFFKGPWKTIDPKNKNNEQKAREYFYDGKAHGGSVKKYAQGGGVRKVRY
tara:strand:+ start:61 stop:243 length:183 start_codon:yes stop_codon:yes gene_type:complete